MRCVSEKSFCARPEGDGLTLKEHLIGVLALIHLELDDGRRVERLLICGQVSTSHAPSIADASSRKLTLLFAHSRATVLGVLLHYELVPTVGI